MAHLFIVHVAPFTGAWIEIFCVLYYSRKKESLPSRGRGLKSKCPQTRWTAQLVAPFTGAWIEILNSRDGIEINGVAPFTGAWIEITVYSWSFARVIVAPFTGAWIEISNNLMALCILPVAPFTGAWIEISSESQAPHRPKSLPSRGRGLKFLIV